VRCIVVTGAGRGFCAGANIGGNDRFPEPEGGAGDLEGHRLVFRMESEMFIAMRRVDVTVMVSINGVAVGAGFDFVCAADLAVASTAARYQVAYVKRGLFADLGGFWSIPKIIGWRKAMEMMMTGNFMSAEEGHQRGLTNYLVAPEDLEAKTMELARDLEDGPPVAQKMGKMLAYRLANQDFETALEMSGVALGIVGATEDRAEGARSFVEKRQPRFRGL
jgi:2-(1,2-epoxy-1,2-dihydrophenyl)acetyl-CoA isomerase